MEFENVLVLKAKRDSKFHIPRLTPIFPFFYPVYHAYPLNHVFWPLRDNTFFRRTRVKIYHFLTREITNYSKQASKCVLECEAKKPVQVRPQNGCLSLTQQPQTDHSKAERRIKHLARCLGEPTVASTSFGIQPQHPSMRLVFMKSSLCCQAFYLRGWDLVENVRGKRMIWGKFGVEKVTVVVIGVEGRH